MTRKPTGARVGDATGGTTVKDMQRLFSNPLLDEMFSDVFT
ncbi:MAG: hypothetical protein WBF43_09000 [Methylocella sp.]